MPYKEYIEILSQVEMALKTHVTSDVFYNKRYQSVEEREKNKD